MSNRKAKRRISVTIEDPKLEVIERYCTAANKVKEGKFSESMAINLCMQIGFKQFIERTKKLEVIAEDLKKLNV